MNKIITFTEYLYEQEGSPGFTGGGGVAFSTLNGNGMGNIIAPTVGSIPGSSWQNGSGTIGSGDRAAYDMDNRFEWKNDKYDKKGKKKKGKKRKYFTKGNI